jgi:outer membrane protein TolC
MRTILTGALLLFAIAHAAAQSLVAPVVLVDEAPADQPGAAGESPVRLTLETAISRGLAASHRIEEIRARRAAALAAVNGQEVADRPQITVQVGYTRTNHIDEFGVVRPDGRLNVIFPDIPDNYRARFDIVWPVYTGGRTEAAVRAARAETAAIDADLAVARADVRLEITRAFWALLSARETIRVVEEATRRVGAQLEDVRTRLRTGLVAPNEVLSVEAQAARQGLALLEARQAHDSASAELGRLTGLDPDRPIEPDARMDVVPAAAPPLGELLEAARRNRPERLSLAERAGGIEARGDAARAGARPTVAVTGGIDYARPNPRILPRMDEWRDSWDLNVNATWLLWDGGRRAAEVAELDAASRAARKRLDEFDSLLAVEIRVRRLDLETSRAAIAVADSGVRAAAEARRVVADRFAAGVATSLDLLETQVDLLQAELARTRALANAHRAAAWLERAVGR